MNVKFSQRMLKIINHAETEALKTRKIVSPIHVLMGALLEKTGVCAELFIKYPTLLNKLRELLDQGHFENEKESISLNPFNIKVSLAVKVVLEKSVLKMKRYKQTVINEGHVISSMFELPDYFTDCFLNEMDVSGILEIISSPRDMIVSLESYSFPTVSFDKVRIRRAEFIDLNKLKEFVETEFGNGWIEAIENGYEQEVIPIYLAIYKETIIGFACYDVVDRKRGLFGPMGTALSSRQNGIGYSLLHHCLNEMDKRGYHSVVIGEAGPIEFYERSCNAVVIPKVRSKY